MRGRCEIVNSTGRQDIEFAKKKRYVSEIYWIQ